MIQHNLNWVNQNLSGTHRKEKIANCKQFETRLLRLKQRLRPQRNVEKNLHRSWPNLKKTSGLRRWVPIYTTCTLYLKWIVHERVPKKVFFQILQPSCDDKIKCWYAWTCCQIVCIQCMKLFNAYMIGVYIYSFTYGPF